MIKATPIDLNPTEINCFPFMISLDRCNRSYNVVDDLSMKTCVPSETRDVNVKAFNMITKRNKVKHWQNIFHVIANANSTVQHVIQIKNGIVINVNVSVKRMTRAKKIIVGIPGHALVTIADI